MAALPLRTIILVLDRAWRSNEMQRRQVLAALGLGIGFAGFRPSRTDAQSGGAAEIVDVEIVLAADGSGSIDDEELALQRRGYAEAITHPDVVRTILGGLHGRIAIAYIEWGGPYSQHTIVDWTLIDSEESAQAFAADLVEAPRAAQGYNSISGAIDYSVQKINTNSFNGLRKIIDVSGDGPQNGGRPVQAARDDAVAQGITINALVVKSRGGGYPGPRGEPLEEHYRNDVIGGFGAFVMTADETLRFNEAVRRKLVLEIAMK